MSSSKLLLSLFQYKSWADEEIFSTLKLLHAVDHEKERHTAIRILNHIYVVDRIFSANLQGIAHPYSSTNTPETPTADELYAASRQTDLWYIKYVSTLTEHELEESISFTFTDGDRGTMSRAEMLAHIITHGGYHRGAVGRIMAQLAIAPPRDIYTKFLHVTEPQRRQVPSSEKL
jgi:uncharacterized damage-inducible protein DinB